MLKLTRRASLTEAHFKGDNVFCFHRTMKEGAGAFTNADSWATFEEFLRDAAKRDKTTYNSARSLMVSIKKKGLLKSKGVYGPPGVYNTYAKESQLNGKMNGYGNLIVKSMTKLYKTLIFDIDFAKEYYGPKDWTLDRQLDVIGVDRKTWERDSTMVQSIADHTAGKFTYSSEIAMPISNSAVVERLIAAGKIYGIVYTGSNDGHCILAYNDQILVPVEFALSFPHGKTLNTPWIKFKDSSAKMVRTRQLQIVDILQSAITSNNDDEIRKVFRSGKVKPTFVINSDFLIFTFVDLKDIKMVRFFIEELGVTPALSSHTRAKNGAPLLSYSIQLGWEEGFLYFLKAKNNMPGKPDMYGRNPMFYAVDLCTRNMALGKKFLKHLLDNGGLPNQKSKDRDNEINTANRLCIKHFGQDIAGLLAS